MKRPIKFRAIYYLKNGKKALSKPFTISEIKSYDSERWGKELYVEGKRGEDVYITSSTEFLQYTGLKDRKGVEIYEGDIIKRDYGNLVIEYSTEVCGFVLREVGRKKNFYDITWAMVENEVIGNIYESPQLLDNTDTKE